MIIATFFITINFIRFFSLGHKNDSRNDERRYHSRSMTHYSPATKFVYTKNTVFHVNILTHLKISCCWSHSSGNFWRQFQNNSICSFIYDRLVVWCKKTMIFLMLKRWLFVWKSRLVTLRLNLTKMNWNKMICVLFHGSHIVLNECVHCFTSFSILNSLFGRIFVFDNDVSQQKRSKRCVFEIR